MANNSINHVDLDFFSLKNSLKEYLKNNNQFKDYDYEGSNINLLLDLLSYNTHKNAFYLNMVLAESFLDSAQLRSSVVSHAKELNYTPISKRSAKATVDVTFTSENSNQKYTIEKGSLFSTIVKNQSYVFSVADTKTITSANTTYSFEADIYEGYYVKDTYVFLINEEVPKFKITNKNVDTNSLTVAVYEDGSNTPTLFKKTETLLGLDNNSKVYFIQSIGDGYYEVFFGDGIMGRKPKTNSVIVLDYRISSGEIANGAKIFSLDFDPTGVGAMLSHSISTVENASGGAEAQTLESVRVYAPRYFATQQRAVASDDYSSIILSNFSDLISDVSVYGGETIEPKLYGRVIIALKPTNGTIAADYVKSRISNLLLDYVSLPTRVVIADPEYLYCKINSTVQYDKTLTNKTPTELEGFISDDIYTFSQENLETFESDFRYSKFVKMIDDVDDSIISNDTSIKIIKRIVPKLNAQETFSFTLNNALQPKEYTTSIKNVITSSEFIFQDEDGNNYEHSYIKDDGNGKLIVYTYINNVYVILNNNIGTVDYSTGLININKLRVNSYNNYISIYGELLNKDIIINKNNILLIDLNDVNIDVIEEFR